MKSAILFCSLLLQAVTAFSPSSRWLVPVGSIHGKSFSPPGLRSPSAHAEVDAEDVPVELMEIEPVSQVNPLNNSTLETSLLSSDTAASSTPSPEEETEEVINWKQRLSMATPSNDDLDKTILSTAIPSMINLAAVPLVNSVDTFWVGRMGSALALAGQAAANSAFFTFFFLVSFLPTITAPLVAAAVGSGNHEEAQARVCESLFLSNLFGIIGTIFLVGFPHVALKVILPPGAPAMEYAAPYLRWRALSMIPALISATGFAAYRGMLNTVTPLKVSLAANALNVVLDPLLIFGKFSMGFCGAALATAMAELSSGLVYLRLLFRQRLARWSRILKPPSWKALAPILQGGLAVLMRQLAINVGIVSSARRAQALDPSGVAAAAYGIVMQLYYVGIVIHVAIQGTSAAIVSSTMAKEGTPKARQVADRMLVWSSLIGIAMGIFQFTASPYIVPMFSTLPAVRDAVRQPAMIASLLHVVNGPIFASEGTLMGLGSFKSLALITAAGVASQVLCLMSPLGNKLSGILASILVFSGVQAVSLLVHHFRYGPLAVKRKQGDARWWRRNVASSATEISEFA